MSALINRVIKVSGLLCLILLLGTTQPSAYAQENEAPIDISKWYFGPVFQQDEIYINTDKNERTSGITYYGLRFFHRMDTSFATGANILFDPKYSSFSISLDSRWIWDLSVVEPYLGIELAYLTRSSGGLNLAPKLGIQVELKELPVLIDFYFLTRYDITKVIFDNTQSINPLQFGIGTTIQYRI